MTGNTGWLGKELLETFYLIVQEYRMGVIDDAMFKSKIFQVAERYARFDNKEESNRDQMSLFVK